MAPRMGADPAALQAWAGRLDAENHESVPQLNSNAAAIAQSSPAFLGPAAPQFAHFMTTVIQLQSLGVAARLTQLAGNLRSNANTFGTADKVFGGDLAAQLPAAR